MSLDAQRSFFETRIENEFKPLYPDFGVYYDNVVFTENRLTMDGFVRVFMIEGMGWQANLGRESHDRHAGELNLSCFVKEDTGTAMLNDMVTALAGLFKKRTFLLPDGSYTTLRVPTYVTMPVQRGYANRIARIPYIRNEPAD